MIVALVGNPYHCKKHIYLSLYYSKILHQNLELEISIFKLCMSCTVFTWGSCIICNMCGGYLTEKSLLKILKSRATPGGYLQFFKKSAEFSNTSSKFPKNPVPKLQKPNFSENLESVDIEICAQKKKPELLCHCIVC